jgi:hypothetical protein
VEGEFDLLLGTSERSFTGQGLPPKREKITVNNFGVNERPDSSSLQARVCGSMAEKLWSPSGSVHGSIVILIWLRAVSGKLDLESQG